MKIEFKFPFWENYQKDRVTCKMITTNESSGKVHSKTATISKYDNNGNLNKDFNKVIEQNTLETINKNTKEREDRHRRRDKEQKARYLEQQQAKKLEELYNAKLEVFEIDEVKACQNRKIKSKIRKAKNKYEMQAYLTILLQDSYNSEK